MFKNSKSEGSDSGSKLPIDLSGSPPVKTYQDKHAQFLGWQRGPHNLFPLYNILKLGHQLFGSTVTEQTLQRMHLRTPRTPSPFPDAAPSPWHRLGVALDSPATAREALSDAGLDFTVVKKRLKGVVRSNYPVDLSNRWVTVRTDTGDLLSIVDEAYVPVQNRDAFAFFDELVRSEQAIYETAGSLGRGERVWILAKLPGYIQVREKDMVSKYLLLTNSHDGSALVQMKLTPIRVVCNNTLTAALKGGGEINIRRGANGAEDAAEALSLLGMANALYEQLEVVFNRMADTKITDQQLMDFVHTLVPARKDGVGDRNAQETRNALLHLYKNGHGADISRGTLWGAFNCVTEYTDHTVESDPADRLASIWIGDQLNRRAFQLAEQLM